ncbi:MAG: ABC transporter ATP-binding protein/permease [Treponema sp.]|jgi:ABC-type multidrug transport system fused ATPase/permease subunit|nr:ABC transporter ATP-binding protein/permease [Treponema sp.]
MNMVLRILHMARKYWGTLLLAATGIVGAALLNLVTPEIVRRLTGALTASSSGNGFLSERMIIMYVIILAAAYLVRAVCRFLSIAVSHIAAWSFVPELTLTVYNKIQSLSLKFFHNRQTGELLSRIVNDTRQFEVLVAHALPDLVSNALVVLSVAIMLFIINPPLALLTLIPVPFVVMMSTLFSKKVQPLFMVNQKVLGDLNGVLQDNLQGMKEIQTFVQEENERIKMGEHTKVYSRVNIRANIASGLYHPGIELLTSLGTVIVVGLGGYMASRGNLPLADVVGFVMYLSLFYQPLATLARLAEDVQNTYAGAVRVFELLDAESEVKEAPDAQTLKSRAGEVRFEHVKFRYSAGDDAVLDDVSFTAKAGRMLAIVGPTGVGKTTVLSLLERFYDPQEGTIYVDGRDIRGLTLSSLRSNISMVLQDTFLFNGSIAMNIAYGSPKAGPEQIRQAAEAACADSFIRAMPQGYDTVVGERGVRLSGGQKQRIAIARAILRDTPILILDEATSAVDTGTESEIQQAVNRLSGSRTIIVIAHRLSTIRRADTILVLENGKVAEQGTHDELIKQGGLYARLSVMQEQTRGNPAA